MIPKPRVALGLPLTCPLLARESINISCLTFVHRTSSPCTLIDITKVSNPFARLSAGGTVGVLASVYI